MQQMFKSKKVTLVTVTLALVILAGGGFFVYKARAAKNPLPTDIKSQISYKTIYPARVNQIAPSSYSYQADQQTLNFNLNYAGQTIVFTEQPAPSSLGSGNQVYYPALGLHPYAQFESKLGPVALAKFYQSGALTAAGESAVLDSQGTLLIAHTNQNLSNAQWKDLIDSLKISQ